MKIDTSTVGVLKSFAKINPSIVVQEGNVLKTISPTKTIMAKAKVGTVFDKRFAIYNLDRFMSIVSTFTDPDFDFGDKSVVISDNDRKTRYVYADEASVLRVPDKEINLPSVDVTFRITNDNLKDVEKAAGILGLPEVLVIGDGNKLSLQVADTKNPTGDVFSIIVGDTDKTFRAVFKRENLRVIPADYDVSISSKGISRFVHEDLEYFIAIEQNSVFN